MKKEYHMIGACGLDCSECDIFAATNNPTIAGQLADWFRRTKNIYVDSRDVRCKGCRGDIEDLWSKDCKIHKCCVEEKKLDFCNECSEFPCEQLVEWSKGDKTYIEALARLKKMKKPKHRPIGEPRIL
ncbi:MAG: DUF3795 domain-containing protein [bacterium]